MELQNIREAVYQEIISNPDQVKEFIELAQQDEEASKIMMQSHMQMMESGKMMGKMKENPEMMEEMMDKMMDNPEMMKKMHDGKEINEQKEKRGGKPGPSQIVTLYLNMS